MAEVQPAYLYPTQWVDDLGAVAAISHQAPRVGFDLASMPVSRITQSAVATSVFQNQVQPYPSGS